MGALQTSIDFIHTLYTLGESVHIVWLDLREWFPSEGVEVEYDCIEYVSHSLFNDGLQSRYDTAQCNE